MEEDTTREDLRHNFLCYSLDSVPSDFMILRLFFFRFLPSNRMRTHTILVTADRLIFLRVIVMLS